MGWIAALPACGLVATLVVMPACAEEDPAAPAGPCSPYRALDGDIPSELPGCAYRLRPPPGSLADELEFRRARASRRAPPATLDDEAAEPELATPPRTRAHLRRRPVED